MKKLYGIIAPASLIIIWQAVSSLHVISQLLLPTPLSVFLALLQIVTSGQIIPDLNASVIRILGGYFLALLISLPIGMLMGYFQKIDLTLEPMVNFLRSVPSTALFPFFLLFFGIGDESKMAIVVYASALILIVSTTFGVKHRNPLRILVAKSLKMNKIDVFLKVIIPEALPEIFVGLRIAISYSIILVIFTEMWIGTTSGLGQVIYEAQLVYEIPTMIAVIFIAGVIGYISNRLIGFVEKKLTPWNVNTQNEDYHG